MVGIPKGKTPHRRLRHRWKDTVKCFLENRPGAGLEQVPVTIFRTFGFRQRKSFFIYLSNSEHQFPQRVSVLRCHCGCVLWCSDLCSCCCCYLAGETVKATPLNIKPKFIADYIYWNCDQDRLWGWATWAGAQDDEVKGAPNRLWYFEKHCQYFLLSEGASTFRYKSVMK